MASKLAHPNVDESESVFDVNAFKRLSSSLQLIFQVRCLPYLGFHVCTCCVHEGLRRRFYPLTLPPSVHVRVCVWDGALLYRFTCSSGCAYRSN